MFDSFEVCFDILMATGQTHSKLNKNHDKPSTKEKLSNWMWFESLNNITSHLIYYLQPGAARVLICKILRYLSSRLSLESYLSYLFAKTYPEGFNPKTCETELNSPPHLGETKNEVKPSSTRTGSNPKHPLVNINTNGGIKF